MRNRCTGQGFAIHDADVDAMSRASAAPRSRYCVVERDRRGIGGGGFMPLAGSDPARATCELRKMYFRPEARGLGVGRALLELPENRLESNPKVAVHVHPSFRSGLESAVWGVHRRSGTGRGPRCWWDPTRAAPGPSEVVSWRPARARGAGGGLGRGLSSADQPGAPAHG
ncbi:MAG: GNAT family N-acetyltransferase [Planctomycetes bacterium]|nr:GNAT family N-acetyltransferase [Planctomycetota bacterium]